jgi:ketosteroid isomerase-like protein
MKPTGISILALLLFFLSLGMLSCSKITEYETSQAKIEVEAVMKEIEQAWVNLPKTKDNNAVLKHYTQDYIGFKGGTPESLKVLEDYLKSIVEQVNLGAPLGISYQMTDIKIGAPSRDFAWVTYDDEMKWGNAGAVLRDDKTRCTALLRRDSDWQVFHEHCSTIGPDFNQLLRR